MKATVIKNPFEKEIKVQEQRRHYRGLLKAELEFHKSEIKRIRAIIESIDKENEE